MVLKMDNETGSLYDFVGPNYVAPVHTQAVKKQAQVQQANSVPVETPAQPVENSTPHANRPHGVLKYENNKQFQQKADSAPVNAAPKTSALYEWGLILASRDSSNYIALKINKDFPRANIGVNFKAEKDRYLAAYKKELHENF